ncbi:hypothetical protein DsansV1_C19g0158121 [Dioscorea sansibarensis]
MVIKGRQQRKNSFVVEMDKKRAAEGLLRIISSQCGYQLWQIMYPPQLLLWRRKRFLCWKWTRRRRNSIDEQR